MDPSQDLDGASSDGEYEDDASLCAFLESEVLGEEEGGDVDDAPRSGAEAGGSDDEEAIAVLGVLSWLDFLLLLDRPCCDVITLNILRMLL